MWQAGALPSPILWSQPELGPPQSFKTIFPGPNLLKNIPWIVWPLVCDCYTQKPHYKMCQQNFDLGNIWVPFTDALCSFLSELPIIAGQFAYGNPDFQFSSTEWHKGAFAVEKQWARGGGTLPLCASLEQPPFPA